MTKKEALEEINKIIDETIANLRALQNKNIKEQK